MLAIQKESAKARFYETLVIHFIVFWFVEILKYYFFILAYYTMTLLPLLLATFFETNRAFNALKFKLLLPIPPFSAVYTSFKRKVFLFSNFNDNFLPFITKTGNDLPFHFLR